MKSRLECVDHQALSSLGVEDASLQHITVLGALNSDVHAKLPFLLESFLADVLCCPVLAICARPVFSTSA